MDNFVLQKEDISHIEAEALDENGFLKVMPISFWKQFSKNQLALFGHKNALYSYPTTEIIEKLKEEIGDAEVLEIASGDGVYGRALGIRSADNHQQERQDVKLHYKMLGQPTITYGKNVERLDGMEAVEKYKPSVVIASWNTHKYREGYSEVGNIHGVDEFEMLMKVDKYIMIGNEFTHRQKEIAALPMTVIRSEGLFSRSVKPEDNCIFIWDNDCVNDDNHEKYLEVVKQIMKEDPEINSARGRTLEYLSFVVERYEKKRFKI